MRVLAHHLCIDERIGFIQEVAPDRLNGVTLVLVHTAGQSGVQWRHSLSRLSELGYRALVPDLPGHGHSEPASGGAITDLADYADWLVRVLDRLGVASPLIVGCSIGGKIAQELAVRTGSRLAGAISMCAEAGPGKGSLRALRRELEDSATPARRDRTHLGTRAVVGRELTVERVSLIATMHCREDPVVSNSDLIGWCSHDARPALGKIECPMRFVAGEDDLWVDPQAVEWAAAQVRRADFLLLPGCGHYPMEELPDFAEVLHTWTSEMIGANR